MDAHTREPSATAPGAASAAALKDVLSSAIESVKHDEQWNVSGIPELLVRARAMAEQGCASAWRTAMSLLDFHKMVQRYRSKVNDPAAQAVCSDLKRVCRESDSSSGDDECDRASTGPPAPAFKRRRLAGEGDDTCSCSSSDGSEFAVPARPAASARRVGAEPISSRRSRLCSDGQSPRPGQQVGQQGTTGTAAPSSAAAASAAPWSVSLRHGSAMDLAPLDVHLPAACSTSLPAELYVSHLVQRTAVKMGRHHVCRTSLSRAAPEQLSRLQALAKHELVAVAPLGPAGRGGSLVLVPYFDNRSALRCVSFLLSRAPAVAVGVVAAPRTVAAPLALCAGVAVPCC